MFRTRCNNQDDPKLPPWQPWQNELPNNGHKVPDQGIVETVKDKIREILDQNPNSIGALAQLGWQCISTHRVTDHTGGCNGARIM